MTDHDISFHNCQNVLHSFGINVTISSCYIFVMYYAYLIGPMYMHPCVCV